MHRISATLGIATLMVSLALPALASDVRTDYDHHADFSGFHTYTIQQVKTKDPFYVDRIKEAITADLNAKGLQEVPSGGDITIMATGTVKSQQELETFYNGMGGGWGGGWGFGGFGWGPGGGFGDSTTTTDTVKQGHLVVDIFQSNTKTLLFRGISTDDVSRKAEKNTKNLDNDIKKMFEKFPPEGKS